jgi:hypothetical protein
VAVAFVAVATANGAGYRYGVSDQAFYIPVVTRALDPSAFPRDGALIDAQGQLMLSDEVVAGLVRATGWDLDWLFLGAYVVSILAVWAGLTLIGAKVYRSAWATTALVAAYTLRHRITRTSANSLEPYFHPRLLAFGLGLLAVSALLRRRHWLAVGLVALAAGVHVTTGLWCAVVVGTAILVLEPRWRRTALPLALAAVAVAGWMLRGGLLKGRLQVMDAVWLQAVASKDSLFATEWPASAWAANLGLLVVLWLAHRYRTARGQATAEDAALVWGATALVALFLATLPFVAARVAFFVQLQMPRVFWVVDALATVYAVAALVGDARANRRRAVVVAAAVTAVAVGRGIYVMRVERPDRALVAVHLPQDAWHDALRWVARQDPRAHVLADPGHAWKFGTSVRVAAARDVLLEEVKDSALAIYSREVATRVVERTHAIGDFSAMNGDRVNALALRYDLHYLVTVSDLPLPEVYRNDRFRVYALARTSRR